MSHEDDNAIKDGSWYLCATCASCKMPIPVMEIDLHASVQAPDFELDVACPHCQETHRYKMGTMTRLQARKEEPPG